MMIDLNTLLPNADDLEMMKSNFEVLVSRYVKVLITFLDNHFFADVSHLPLTVLTVQDRTDCTMTITLIVNKSTCIIPT